MARRYASRPLRRDSVSSGEDEVERNQDFAGRGEGGGAEVCERRVSSSWANSE